MTCWIHPQDFENEGKNTWSWFTFQLKEKLSFSGVVILAIGTINQLNEYMYLINNAKREYPSM